MGVVALIVMSIACGGEVVDTELGFDQGKWVDAWVKMWNSYDLDEVDRLFLQDQRLSYFSSEKEGVIQGIAAVREHHVGFGFVPGGKSQPNRLWLEEVQADEFADVVVVTAIWFFQKESGEEQRGPVTIVYIPVEEGFRIAHMNFAEYQEDVTM
jgi:hypothetical protein